MIYLDNAATSMPKPLAVYEAVSDAMKTCASLGRSGHAPAQKASRLAYQCREAAGTLFGLEPEQVVFTSNATHGLNIAIKTLVHPGDEVIVSGFEHNAVIRPLTHLHAKIRVVGKKLFSPDDMVKELSEMISPRTKAVICTHVSNVFGYILPIERVAAICREQEVPLIVDAAQSAGILPLSMKELGAAFIAMPGHKGLLGPQGTGLLLCGMMPAPIMEGGTGSRSKSYEMPDFLPDCVEAGTHNTPGIAGLLAGISYIQETGLRNIQLHETALIDFLAYELKKMPIVHVFHADRTIQSGALSFQLMEGDCELFAQAMAERGYAVRAGLHCAPLAHESAGTLETGTVRISVSTFNHEEELASFVQDAKEVLTS